MDFEWQRLTLRGDLQSYDVIILEEIAILTDLPTTDVVDLRSVGILEGGFLSDPTSSGRCVTCER